MNQAQTDSSPSYGSIRVKGATPSLARAFGLTERQSRAALGALRAVVEAKGSAGVHGVQLLETAAATLDLGNAWQAVPSATAAQIGEAFPSPVARRVLLDALLIPACVEGEVTAEGERVVVTFARALGIHSPWVDLLGAMRARNVVAVKRQLVRRSPDARRIFARTWSEEGVAGLFRAGMFVLGLHRDAPLAARFRALGALPEGTLGRTFFDHLAGRGLSFPGEKGGLPERMIHHDLMHVVNGYGTDAAGECELAGFYAAFADGDAFTFLAIALATFQIGLPVSPAAVTPATGAFDVARVIDAFVRGRRLRIDVMGPWDYWALMPLSLDAVRAELGIGGAPRS